MKIFEIERIEHFFKDNLDEFKERKRFTNMSWRIFCNKWFLEHYGEPMGMRKITQIVGNCARVNGFYFFTSVVMYDGMQNVNFCIFTEYAGRPYLDIDKNWDKLNDIEKIKREQWRTERQWKRNQKGIL